MLLIPERSVEANVATSVLYQDFNEIDIYIEDTAIGYDKLFLSLLCRVFQGKYKVKKVFPIGSRQEVIDQFTIETSSRPYLYIIDGDLYLTIGDSVQNQKGLFKLPFYCVENILCDCQSFLEIIDEESPSKKFEDIEKEFDFEDWVNENENKLFELFIEYSVCKHLYPQEQTVHYKVSNLVSCNKGMIDDLKLQARINHIKNCVISNVGEEKYNEIRNKFLQDFQQATTTKLDIVSGKDYIFPLLKTRARAIITDGKITDSSFKLRLAKTCDISKIQNVMNYIANAS